MVNNSAIIAELEERHADALAASQESLRLKEQILGSGHPDVAISLGNVAFGFAKLNRIDEALVYSERAIAIDERAIGVDHPDTALQLENRADFLNIAGRFSEADGLGRRALAIWQREMGTDHPSTANALTIIGRSSLGIGNFRDAIATLERAYAIRSEFDPQPSRLAETEFLLAQALWSKRPSRKAIEIALEAKAHYSQASNRKGVVDVTRWLATHDSY